MPTEANLGDPRSHGFAVAESGTVPGAPDAMAGLLRVPSGPTGNSRWGGTRNARACCKACCVSSAVLLPGNARFLGSPSDTTMKIQPLCAALLALAPTAAPAALQVTPYGFGVNPPGSLLWTSGQPVVGESFTVGVSNTATKAAPPSLAFLSIASAPDPAFPSGTVLAGLGLAGHGLAGQGAPGELLLSLVPSHLLATLGPVAWAGGVAEPANFPLAVPSVPTLAGWTLYLQGALLALSPEPTLGVSNGLSVVLATAKAPPKNVLLIVADDVGVDLIGAYGESAAAPCTTHIDALASSGLLFRNAWANPVCSPTRAALMTGRYGFRTGIGGVVMNNTPGLPLGETTLAERLSDYSSAWIGKWHLAGNLGNLHPNQSGFEHFSGILGGSVNSYFQWPQVTNGVPSLSTEYTTSAFTDAAIAEIAALPEPWFLVVSYNAAHTPFHVPPAELCVPTGCANSWCDSLPPNPNDRQLARAIVESLDTEIGRLIGALDSTHPDTYVFFVGDNGTPGSASIPPFQPNHAKGTMYEGGINVPWIVRGPGVVQGECAGLVSAVDLFATIAELGQSPGLPGDSVSMVPYFADPALSLRSSVYAETFTPNGGALPFAAHSQAVRSTRYKLIRRTGQADEFYDLELDPFETSNLLPGLTASEQLEYDALTAELVALGVP